MQQLFDILTHKLTIINHPISNLTNTQKDELLDQLVIEKKKEALRILVQTRLQQSLDTKIVCDAEQLNYIVTKTHRVMSICDQQLVVPQREEPLLVMVELFYTFFNRQNCTNRAQEILNMYKKKLCPRGMLPSTLFNWLIEWTRKQFQEYLKKTIHSLYVDSKHPKTHRQNHKDDHQKPESSFLIIQKKQAFPTSKTIQPSEPLERKQNQSLEADQKKISKIRTKSHSPSQRSLRFPSIESIEPELPINKEVFYYAYSQQIQTLYKQLENCIPDLDVGFVRGLRRGGVRRKQVKRRIKEVADNIVRHMGDIKQGIQKYYQEYTSAHRPPQQLKRAKKQRKITLDSQCQSPSKTSQGVRTISTSAKHINERHMRIISTLFASNRYGSQQPQSTRSYLLPNHHLISQTALPNNKTLDLSIGNQKHQQPKLLILNSVSVSPNLQIIEEKRQKIKGRGIKKLNKQHQHQQNHTPNKRQAQKPKFSKSINLKDTQQFERASNSIDVSASSHLHLPKIGRLK